MVKEYSRSYRVAQEIQKVISLIFHREIKDPRIRMTTVSNVKVSRDLTYAKIFVTFLNNNTFDQVESRLQALQNATGFVRNMLGKIMYLRLVPKLFFFYDESILAGVYMANLVNKVVKNDQIFQIENLLNDQRVIKDNKD